MKTINTQTEQLNLIVTRDGQEDQEFMRHQHMVRIGNTVNTAATSSLQAVGSFVGNILHNVHTEVALAVHDSINHTSLRQEREQRLHDEREEAFKAKFRLV